MNVLVVDDEPLARDRLIRFLQDVDTVELTHSASNAEDALQKLQADRYDVVLLDVRMPGKSGIEVAERIRQMPEAPAVIFCTAYDEYALQAFQVNAQSYLLKPIQRQALYDALNRSQHLTRAQISALNSDSGVPSIVVQSGRGKERVPLSDVYYFKADQKYVSMFGVKGERVVDDSLKYLEEAFSSQLIRVHRNTLVMRARIEKLKRDLDGGFWVVINGVQEALPVSRRHARDIKKLFENQ